MNTHYNKEEYILGFYKETKKFLIWDDNLKLLKDTQKNTSTLKQVFSCKRVSYEIYRSEYSLLQKLNERIP
jgi:hypothetical protein